MLDLALFFRKDVVAEILALFRVLDLLQKLNFLTELLDADVVLRYFFVHVRLARVVRVRFFQVFVLVRFEVFVVDLVVLYLLALV